MDAKHSEKSKIKIEKRSKKLKGVYYIERTDKWSVVCTDSETQKQFQRRADTFEEAAELRKLSDEGKLTKKDSRKRRRANEGLNLDDLVLNKAPHMEGYFRKVVFSKKYERYGTQLRKKGLSAIWLGYFDTLEEANEACNKALQGMPIKKVRPEKRGKRNTKSGLKGIFWVGAINKWRVECVDNATGKIFRRDACTLEEAENIRELSDLGKLSKTVGKPYTASGIEGVHRKSGLEGWSVVCMDAETKKTFNRMVDTLEEAVEMRRLSAEGKLTKNGSRKTPVRKKSTQNNAFV